MKKLKNKSTGGVTIEDTFGGRIGKEGMIGTMDFRDSDGDGTDDRYQKGPGMADSRGDFGRGKPIIGISPDSLSPKNMAEEKKKNGRVAGSMMGLAPTQVTQNFRGAGFGMTYGNSRPRTGGTVTYGGQPTNQINFAPVMSNVGGNTTVNTKVGTGGGTGGGGGRGGKGGGGRGGKGGGKGPKDVTTPGFKSIADSGFNPADYGAAGLGMQDYEELTGRGYNDRQIKKYAEKAGVQIGGKLQARLGLDGGIAANFNPADYGSQGLGLKDYEELTNRGYTDKQIKDYAGGAGVQIGGALQEKFDAMGKGGGQTKPSGGGQSKPSGGQESQTAGGSQQNTVRGLRDLNTGVKTYDSINDAKNVFDAYRTATGNKNAGTAVSDRRIGNLVSNAGIRSFDSKNDARKLTNYLINRSSNKAQGKSNQNQGGGNQNQGGGNQQQKKATNPQPKSGISIQQKLKREIKKATGSQTSDKQLQKIIKRANVGKRLNLKDVNKVVRAAKKAKAVQNRRKKNNKRKGGNKRRR